MKETILLFNFSDKQKLLQLECTLFPYRVRVRRIDKADYMSPLGYLAGNTELEPAAEPYEGKELPEEMIVFVNLPDQKLNTILAAMRKNQIGPISHKAILTPTNQYWNVIQCYEELSLEHQAMHSKKPEV